ncbi:hypothetical protein D3C72_1229550 [compost metagenome]
MVGGAGAVPDTVGVRNAQAAVFRLDRAVVVGEADAGFPGRVDVPGTTDGVAGGILELLVFLQADPTGTGVAGGLELLEGAPVGPVDGVVHRELLVQTVVTGELGLGRQIQLQVAIDGPVAGGQPLEVAVKAQVYLGAVGQGQAVVVVDLVQGADVPAKAPGVTLEVSDGGVAVVRHAGFGGQARCQGTGIAVQLGLGIDGIDTGTHAEVGVDAVGDVGVDVEGQQLGITGTGTGREGLGVLGGEAVVGEEANPPGPLIVQGLDEVGGRHEGIGGDVALAGRGQLGRTGIDVTRDIHVGLDIGTGNRQCHLVEGGHGGRVAGQHGRVVGDGGFTGIGAAQTGGRVFVQLERGGEGLSAGQGDGRGDQAFLEKGSCHSVLSL